MNSSDTVVWSYLVFILFGTIELIASIRLWIKAVQYARFLNQDPFGIYVTRFSVFRLPEVHLAHRAGIPLLIVSACLNVLLGSIVLGNSSWNSLIDRYVFYTIQGSFMYHFAFYITCDCSICLAFAYLYVNLQFYYKIAYKLQLPVWLVDIFKFSTALLYLVTFVSIIILHVENLSIYRLIQTINCDLFICFVATICGVFYFKVVINMNGILIVLDKRLRLLSKTIEFSDALTPVVTPGNETVLSKMHIPNNSLSVQSIEKAECDTPSVSVFNSFNSQHESAAKSSLLLMHDTLIRRRFQYTILTVSICIISLIAIAFGTRDVIFSLLQMENLNSPLLPVVVTAVEKSYYAIPCIVVQAIVMIYLFYTRAENSA